MSVTHNLTKILKKSALASIFLLVFTQSINAYSYDSVIEAFTGVEPKKWGLQFDGIINRLPQEEGTKKIALTLDACGGSKKANGYDKNLLDFLKENQIPATLFVNARWVKANPQVFSELTKEPLFEIANHGLAHQPCSVTPKEAYGIKATGSVTSTIEEISGGAQAIMDAGGIYPRLFRSGTAHYDDVSVKIANRMGYDVIGYSLNADGGAAWSAQTIEKQMLKAKPGDIIICHFNRPDGQTADGLIKAIPKLIEDGYQFVHLPYF